MKNMLINFRHFCEKIATGFYFSFVYALVNQYLGKLPCIALQNCNRPANLCIGLLPAVNAGFGFGKSQDDNVCIDRFL